MDDWIYYTQEHLKRLLSTNHTSRVEDHHNDSYKTPTHIVISHEALHTLFPYFPMMIYKAHT
jgi:hypothetical protein